jgi:hypothetical protein
MSGKASFALRGRNPDVLTCIANLSNDEVFSPPEFANRMLDNLADAWAADNDGANIWADSSVSFLDPCTKSGVFLREIASRLTNGLADEIPDLEARVDHILTNQVFGIGITQLTSLLARRSLYCSKHAAGEHSIARSFSSDNGNIWFERTEHTWVDDRCKYCGASKTTLARGDDLETHAYACIHTDDIGPRVAEMFGGDMQFDVIIGNPPYQLDDGGYGTSAAPIYNKFVDQAKKLEPRLLCMVIPARWFSGGKGLDEFREGMLADNRVRVIDDFPDSNDVFPGTQIKGGVCFFLWNRDNPGNVRVVTHDKGEINQPMERALVEPGADVFIRYNEALPILKKVIAVETGEEIGNAPLALPVAKQLMAIVSSSKPFGLRTYYQGLKAPTRTSVLVYQNGGVGYVERAEVTKNHQDIDRWKVFTARAGSGSDAFPHPILGKPFIGGPGSISTETYNYIGPLASEEEANNLISYFVTRLFRFLVLLHKPSQDANRAVYTFVPKQDFSRSWDDDKLRCKYGITDDEWAFIERMIRPMDYGTDNFDG